MKKATPVDDILHYLYRGSLYDFKREDYYDKQRASRIARLYHFGRRYEVENLLDLVMPKLRHDAMHDFPVFLMAAKVILEELEDRTSFTAFIQQHIENEIRLCVGLEFPVHRDITPRMAACGPLSKELSEILVCSVST
jgi:hypothetical protein